MWKKCECSRNVSWRVQRLFKRFGIAFNKQNLFFINGWWTNVNIHELLLSLLKHENKDNISSPFIIVSCNVAIITLRWSSRTRINNRSIVSWAYYTFCGDDGNLYVLTLGRHIEGWKHLTVCDFDCSFVQREELLDNFAVVCWVT